MENMYRIIRLYGVLGATFGRVHKMAVETPQEAIRALSIVIPNFERFLNTSRKRGLTFSVFSGSRNLAKEELCSDKGLEDIRIAPIIIGSKNAGLFQTILGAALITVGVLVSGLSYGFAAPVGGALVSAGIGLAAGGVIQMLSPQASGLASKQDSDNQASYAFGGVTNTASQGYPVPLGYGRRRVGGAIISAGIYVEDQQ